MLIYDFNLNYINSLLIAPAGAPPPTPATPLKKSMVENAQKNFETCYINPFAGIGGATTYLNQNISDQYALKVNLQTFINHLGLNTPANPNEGGAFYYILNRDINNKWYFSYALTPAEYQNHQVTATPPGSIQYLTPLHSGNNTLIDGTNINPYIADFNNNVEVRELGTDQKILAADFQSQINTKHPTNTFLDKQQLTKFITDNGFSIASPPQNVYVRFLHGGVYLKKFGSYNVRVLTTILVLEDFNQPTSTLLLDNEPYDITALYKNKAMNVGRLCPPQCD